ncbi:MAG: preprotein translocase subunit YajC [Hyphomonadaceae bacterium]|nr:MAG: preprotein translocase subunit YajC [Hyphomonadaceae bacterium]
MFSTPAFAQTANAVATGPTSLLMNLLPMVAVLGVFYFLLIRPQQARQKAHMALINGLKRGVQLSLRQMSSSKLFGTP